MIIGTNARSDKSLALSFCLLLLSAMRFLDLNSFTPSLMYLRRPILPLLLLPSSVMCNSSKAEPKYSIFVEKLDVDCTCLIGDCMFNYITPPHKINMPVCVCER